MILRRLSGAAILIAIAVTAVLAQPRVTFVLKNGERFTGNLVYHHTSNIGIRSGGREQAWDFNDIAVIEFASGRPSARELNGLPRPTRELLRHALVLNDGTVIPGKLYDVSDDGNTITIDVGNEGPGNYERRRYGANDIARLYISPSDAPGLYPSAEPVAPPVRRPQVEQPPPPQPRGNRERVPADAIRVEGRRPWTDTGIEVSRGERISFETTGEVHWGQGNTQVAGPDGANIERRLRRNYPVPEMGVGGLIARVDNSRPFPIGSNTGPITMPADGILYLGINDDSHGDNSGAFFVRVRRR
jgi:hypothetical protein